MVTSMKKSAILVATILGITTAAHAQTTSPPNCPAGYECIPSPKCPPGYQCKLTDPDAAANAATESDQATCPPGYHPDDRGHCLLSDLEAATKSQQAREQAEQGQQPKKEPDPNGPVAGAKDVSDEDSYHADPCWSLRLQDMKLHTTESRSRFEDCLVHHNYNN